MYQCLVVCVSIWYFCFYSFLLPGGIQGEDADEWWPAPCLSSIWTWPWLTTARWTPPSMGGRWRTSSTAYGSANHLSLWALAVCVWGWTQNSHVDAFSAYCKACIDLNIYFYRHNGFVISFFNACYESTSKSVEFKISLSSIDHISALVSTYHEWIWYFFNRAKA
jgi:hypothetical protein